MSQQTITALLAGVVAGAFGLLAFMFALDEMSDWLRGRRFEALRCPAEEQRLRDALEMIAFKMPTEERNPDGDEQAAHSMQTLARSILKEIEDDA